MADVAKYELISPSSNGGPSSLFLDLKRPFKTRRSLALLTGFFFIFVSFTLLLTFAPSFSPLFNNPFSSDSSNTSSPSPSTSSRSDFPSISSYYFPDSAPRSPNPAALPPPLTTTTTPIPSPPPPPPPSLHLNESTTPTPIPSPPPPSLHRNESTTPTPIPSPPPPLRRNESSAAFAAPVRLNSTANSGVVALAVKSNFTSASSEKQDGGGGGSNATSPAPTPAKKGDLLGSMVSCDLYDGEWVRDDSYPLYKPGSCKLIDEQFNCFANGRPDHAYFKYRWKPRGCTIPRLNGGHLLKLLRGKRVVFVGDSLNRNMWESLICILRSSVKNPKNVFEAHGNLHFRTEAAYSFLFKDYNFTLEFFASPFLVRQWEVKGKDGKTKETLRIDMIAESANKFKTADILIFNTGHWWTHWKTSSGKDYYQEGSHVYNDLNVAEAYRRAITTWARWVDANVDPSKTHVLFRGYSNSHFSGGQWNSGGACDNETEPIKNTAYLTEYPWKDKVVESILKQMKTRVSYLNVTRITDYRKDGHPSIYRKLHVPEEERKAPMQYQDCSHWCLPGVPDTWNELLYAELIRRQYKQQKHITL